MQVNIKRLDTGLPLPQYAYDGDAGFDLYAAEDVVLESLQRESVPTSVSIEVPEGYVGLIWDRSGLSIKHGIKVLGGVIDAGYRGEVRIGVVNVSKDLYTINRGDRIAQMIIQERVAAKLVEVEELSDTERGDKRFGSSGM